MAVRHPHILRTTCTATALSMMLAACAEGTVYDNTTNHVALLGQTTLYAIRVITFKKNTKQAAT